MIWIFVALLVGWGNVGSALLAPGAALPGGSWSFVAAGAALTGVSLAVAWRAGLDRQDLGLGGDWPRGVAIGALCGGLVAAAGVGALHLASVVVGAPVVYDPLRDVGGAELTRHLLFFLPLGTVLPEEIAFRGAVHGLLRPRGAGAAVIGSAIAFALWHATIAIATVDDTTLAAPSVWFGPAVAGALVVVFAGGAVLALLRAWTRTLATPIAAHWTFNATLLLGLWATLPAPAPRA